MRSIYAIALLAWFCTLNMCVYMYVVIIDTNILCLFLCTNANTIDLFYHEHRTMSQWLKTGFILNFLGVKLNNTNLHK